ncbi:autophagy-related protein 101-like isoform X3 [Carya illinoinensis]|uniref:autophagy-related protein 101-like isoform X3 n=1 Tax=Carya illinoinensis TaxID=32201 RepID=UPI001C724C67|nr:autophagy-related protein 101-like isoform X3 [Carya illinoinensis]
MNCEVCQLKELEVEHFEIGEVLRCILHTIVFHRALGLVRPKDVDLELFEITYICLSFYEEKKNKQPSWFSNKIERIHWEQWYISLNVAQHTKAHSSKSHHSKLAFDPAESAVEERSVRRAALEASLREVMFQIIKFANEKKDHVPPIPNREGIVSFPYEITIPRCCFLEVSLMVVSVHNWNFEFMFCLNWPVHQILHLEWT